MKLNKTSLVASLACLLIFSACKKEEEPEPSGTFTVTIENVFEAKAYFASRTTEGIGPGSSYSFSFDAGKGHSLSFATMLAQSNDLFYAPAQNGIALYDANGVALTGDITAMLHLWDAGTEVNEEPGTGANQAPRQSGPDTDPEEN